MADPVHRRGEWWQEQPGGGWLKWDEPSGRWQPQEFPPPPPDTPPPAAVHATSPQAGPATVSGSPTSERTPPGPATESPAPTPGYKYARSDDGTWWARSERTGELHWHDAGAGIWRKYVGSPQVPGEAPGGPSTDYAGFWHRFGAFVIDAIVLIAAAVAIGLVLGLVAGGFTGDAAVLEEDETAAGAFFQLLALLGQWLYFALMESSSKQATLGKMAVGLRVTDMDGNRVGFGKATGRYFGKIVSGLILGIGYLMIAWTKKKQALHDQMAGTLVLTGRPS